MPVAIGLDRRLPFLNGPPEWRWIYGNNTIFFWPTWLKAAPLLLAGLLPLAWLCRRTPHPAARLAAFVAFGFYLHLVGYLLATPAGINHWGRILVDPETTSYFTVSQWVREDRLPPLTETLRRYPELLEKLPKHASTHPPGAVLACAAVQRAVAAFPRAAAGLGQVYEWLGMDPAGWRYPATRADAVAATTLGILIVLIGLLGAVPLWVLVRDSETPGAEAVAWSAAALWVAYPALMIFEPQFDQIYPTLVLACLWAAQRGLRGNRPALWGALAGLLFMLGIFFSFVLLFVAPMLLLLAIWERGRTSSLQPPASSLVFFRIPHSAFRMLSGALAACFATEALLRWGFGIRLFETFLAAVRLQREVLLPGVHRHYHVWLFYNFYDFLFFAGTPLAVLALAWVLRVERGFKNIWALTAPAWAVFPAIALALNVLGLTPGETSRIWLFLAPGIVWAGASELVHRSGAGWRASLAVLLTAQTMFYFLCRAKLTFIGW